MKYYCIMHRADYSEEDIMDMVEPINIKRHYSESTRWEPGEDYITCDYTLDKNFYDVIKIAEFYYYDKDEPFAVIVNDNTYCLGEKEEWIETLESLGWVFFEDKFEMAQYESTVKFNFEDWLDTVANEKAWAYIKSEEEE